MSDRKPLSTLLARLGPFIVLIFVFALFAFLRPRMFLTMDNMQIMLLQTAVVATAALGMTLIIVSGGIDLSIGSNIALCTVVVALLLSHQVPPILAALGGIAVSAAAGALIGGFVTKLKLTPFIVTLGMWGALRGAAKGLSGETMVVAPTTWLNGLLQTLPADRRLRRQRCREATHRRGRLRPGHRHLATHHGGLRAPGLRARVDRHAAGHVRQGFRCGVRRRDR